MHCKSIWPRGKRGNGGREHVCCYSLGGLSTRCRQGQSINQEFPMNGYRVN